MSETCQSPPAAFSERTLAVVRRREISNALRSLPNANVCAMTTSIWLAAPAEWRLAARDGSANDARFSKAGSNPLQPRLIYADGINN